MTTEISLFEGLWNFNHRQTIWDQKFDTSVRASLGTFLRAWGTLWEPTKNFKTKIAATGELRILHLHSLTHTTDVMYLSMVWRHARVYGHFPYYIQQLLCPEMYLLIIFPVTTKFLLLHFNQMLAACVPASSWKLTVDGWENKEDKNFDFYDKLSLQH
jgi:hypothetical protein